MDSIFHWIIRDGNALAAMQLFAAFVTALATLALWRVTNVLAKETSALARMTSRPFVVCSLESSLADPTALDLTVRNTGNATAFDVHFKISPALRKPDGSEPELTSEAEYKVSLLPPGQRLPIAGVMGRDIGEKRYTAKVSWAALPGANERESINYQFEPSDGFRGGWNTKGLHQVANELERIRKLLPKS